MQKIYIVDWDDIPEKKQEKLNKLYKQLEALQADTDEKYCREGVKRLLVKIRKIEMEYAYCNNYESRDVLIRKSLLKMINTKFHFSDGWCVFSFSQMNEWAEENELLIADGRYKYQEFDLDKIEKALPDYLIEIDLDYYEISFKKKG